jgi:putative Holliday junction resolvase
MRVAALDVGRRRTGIAISDPSGTLARPLTTVSGDRMLHDAIRELTSWRQDEDGLELVVVGLPCRADGSDGDMTTFVQAFAAKVQRSLGCPLLFQDERLTSHEADGLLAERERDWRKRKAMLDAAAAAVILQEYLDGRHRAAAAAAAAAQATHERAVAGGGDSED